LAELDTVLVWFAEGVTSAADREALPRPGTAAAVSWEVSVLAGSLVAVEVEDEEFVPRKVGWLVLPVDAAIVSVVTGVAAKLSEELEEAVRLAGAALAGSVNVKIWDPAFFRVRLAPGMFAPFMVALVT